jgi:hypothetical protein
MDSDATPYLRHDIRHHVVEKLARLQEAGWTIQGLHWQSEHGRIVNFTARSPTGGTLHLMCAEDDLLDHLIRIASRKSGSTQF